jgi:hypothetical protein
MDYAWVIKRHLLNCARYTASSSGVSETDELQKRKTELQDKVIR